METKILSYFSCPRKIKKKTCHNELVLDEVFSFFKSGTKELKEGYLKCKACGSRFPIFFGIPVLVSNVAKYLRDNFYVALELSKEYGKINKGLVADSLLLAKQAKPKDKKELFEHTKAQYAMITEAIFENSYLINYYDSFVRLAKSNEPLYDFLNKYKDKNPHLALDKFLSSYSKNKGALALEIGCNAGGFLRQLSKNANFAFGLDSSFAHLFFASCLLKGIPKRISQYRVIVEADIKRKRTLKVNTVNNLALVVGEADNLPFKDSLFSIVSSCNMIDIVDNPIGLLKEKIRVLKKNGLLLSSDPYQFLSGNKKELKIKKGQTPWQRIEEILKPKIKILEEQDNIPWITRSYQRNYSIYYNHSFCGRKTY